MTPLESEILSYFREHPEASDTIDGIAFWWLKERNANRTLDEVQSALDRLASFGLISERVDISGRVHYRLIRNHDHDST